MKQHHLIFPLLDLSDKIRVCYIDLCNNITDSWKLLQYDEKCFLVYFIIKKETDVLQILNLLIDLQNNNPENQPLIKCVLKLLWAKENPQKRNIVFEAIDRLLTDYIISQANESKYRFNDDKYYICIHCGSGSPHSKGYRPGDIYPKCGDDSGMIEDSNPRYRSCKKCSHKIRLSKPTPQANFSSHLELPY